MVSYYKFMKVKVSKVGAVTTWFLLTNILSLLFISQLILPSKEGTGKYSFFSSKPPSSFNLREGLVGEDARPEIIDQYFARFDCPLTGYGEKMVSVADAYGFEFWWLPAIAWQESSCGKQLIGGSYNPFGYGIYGDNVIRFTSFDEAIEQVGWDLSANFFGEGLVHPCDVQSKYTPPSNGSWCSAIEYFRDEMLNYKSSESK